MYLSILVISRTYQLLNRMLESIDEESYINNKNSEILCSWNGETKDLKKIRTSGEFNLKLIEIKPYNFAKNMNELIKISTGEYLLVINDDVILDKNSIQEGLNLLKKNINIGLVGGNLRDKENNLTHAGVNFNFLNSAYHFLENLTLFNNWFLNKSFIITASTGALMITKKEIFKELSFNEHYEVCGEDIELCLDINQLLRKEIWYCNNFKGIHEAESTRKKVPNQRKNNLDKIRLKRRYKLFLNDLSVKQLIDLYNFDKKILFFILRSKIKTYKGRIHTDHWLILLINMIKIKFKIYLKVFKSNLI